MMAASIADPTAISDNKGSICRTILEDLPDWFAFEAARERYIDGAERHPMFACFHQHHPIGMVVVIPHNDWNAEIYVLGVLRSFHRHGVGRRLIATAARFAEARGAKFLTVKTLSGAVADPHYEKTRRFYRAQGFAPFEELPDLWDPEHPCLLMIRPVNAPHGDAANP